MVAVNSQLPIPNFQDIKLFWELGVARLRLSRVTRATSFGEVSPKRARSCSAKAEGLGVDEAADSAAPRDYR